MKKSELRQIIKEEYQKILKEESVQKSHERMKKLTIESRKRINKIKKMMIDRGYDI